MTCTLFGLLILMGFQQAVSQPCETAVLTSTGSCYWKSGLLAIWDAALQACQSQGGTLAVIDSLEVQQTIDTMSLGLGTYWFGLGDGYLERRWRWTTTRLMSYSDWIGGSPPLSNYLDNCGYYYLGKMYVGFGLGARNYLCQSQDVVHCLGQPDCMPLVSWDIAVDTDFGILTIPTLTFDGIATVEDCITLCEPRVDLRCETIRYYSATLRCEWFVFTYSHPIMGAVSSSDSTITVASRKPLRPADSITLFEVPGPLTFDQALSSCVAEGGTLPTMDSVFEVWAVPTTAAIWLGLRDDLEDGIFRHLDDSDPPDWLPLFATFPLFEQPSGGTAEQCLVMDGDETIRDVDCTLTFSVLCEIVAETTTAMEMTSATGMTTTETTTGMTEALGVTGVTVASETTAESGLVGTDAPASEPVTGVTVASETTAESGLVGTDAPAAGIPGGHVLHLSYEPVPLSSLNHVFNPIGDLFYSLEVTGYSSMTCGSRGNVDVMVPEGNFTDLGACDRLFRRCELTSQSEAMGVTSCLFECPYWAEANIYYVYVRYLIPDDAGTIQLSLLQN